METEERVQHVYDFARLDHVPEGPTSLQVTARRLLSGPDLQRGKSSTIGAVLAGEHIICTLGTQARGTGAKAHSHANEQFNYILQGTMMSDIEGDRVFAPRGMILHTPGMVVHTGLACPDEDLVFFAVKDTRTGIVGPPVDGKYDGPNCFPGFGSRSDEPRITTADAIEQSRARPPGPGKRYVYDMARETDRASGPASAEITPDADLRLPPGITGKLLTGERLHVGVQRFARGAKLANYRRDNEQLLFVIEGGIEADLQDQVVEVGPRSVVHLPAGTRHTVQALDDTLLLIAQDKRAADAL
jgi:quercetin dioxygenase-like cupin family protein